MLNCNLRTAALNVADFKDLHETVTRLALKTFLQAS